MRQVWKNLFVLSYLLGFALNLILVVILMSNRASSWNMQIPEGRYADNRWAESDVMSYVKPARNFLEQGVFGNGQAPDYVRTIGYPFFLAMMMKFFGSGWHLWTVIIQAALFAGVYPAILKIADVLFNPGKRLLIAIFIFSVLSGLYFASVPEILTDLFTGVFFTIGLCFGAMAITKQSWLFLILQVFFIGWAAQTRPTLTIYPVINILVLLSVAKLRQVKKVNWLIAVSTLSLLLLCNWPSVRNYTNYGFFAPSERLSFNLFNINVKDILLNSGQEQRLARLQEQIYSLDDIGEQFKLKRKLAFMIYAEYPIATLKIMTRDITMALGYSHWLVLPDYWEHDRDPESFVRFSKTSAGYCLKGATYIYYAVVYSFFAYFMVNLLRKGKLLYFAALTLLLGCFLGPALVVYGMQRLRVPVEGIILIFSFYQIQIFLQKSYHMELNGRLSR